MHFLFRTASCATHRPKTQPSYRSSKFSHGKQSSIRFSSTGHKSAANNMKNGTNTPPKSQYSFIPTPTPPHHQVARFRPSTRTTLSSTVRETLKLLTVCGWVFSGIFPNGNGIAVLRKRFAFANALAGALEEFLADVGEYEMEENQVRSHSVSTFTCHIPGLSVTLVDCQYYTPFNVTQRRMCSSEDHHTILVSTRSYFRGRWLQAGWSMRDGVCSSCAA